jgi:ATP-dependent helicase YprA (DUF1998 family)
MDLSRNHKIPISEAASRGLTLLAPAFVMRLTPEQQDIVFEAFFRLDYLSRGLKFPCLFQLDFTLALRAGRDVVLRVGTGYGKPIAMVLPIILSRGQVAITISPLKLLQETQVCTLKLPDIMLCYMPFCTGCRVQSLWHQINCH